MDIGITMDVQGCGAAGGAGDTVCLERAELQDLLRRVRGLERMIGRVLGARAVAKSGPTQVASCPGGGLADSSTSHPIVT